MAMFKELDADNDGQLSRKELLKGFHKQLGNKKQAEEQVEKIFKMVDQDDNGCIDYTEFLQATINREKFLSKKRLKTAFRMFDKDGDGSINKEELKKVFKQIKCDEEVWEELMKEVDKDNDGEINFREFKMMMTHLA